MVEEAMLEKMRMMGGQIESVRITEVRSDGREGETLVVQRIASQSAPPKQKQ